MTRSPRPLRPRSGLAVAILVLRVVRVVARRRLSGEAARRADRRLRDVLTVLRVIQVVLALMSLQRLRRDQRAREDEEQEGQMRIRVRAHVADDQEAERLFDAFEREGVPVEGMSVNFLPRGHDTFTTDCWTDDPDPLVGRVWAVLRDRAADHPEVQVRRAGERRWRSAPPPV